MCSKMSKMWSILLCDTVECVEMRRNASNASNVSRVCRKTLFSSDQFETPGELSLGMDY